MRLPFFWKKKQKPLVALEPLLSSYPIYDPPHKQEERILSTERALENFEYFMRVRSQRVADFKSWLEKNFGVVLRNDEEGVAALNDWIVSYGGALLPKDPLNSAYFTYDPAWSGSAAGCNVAFDLGIVFGELIIANCPKLHWVMDPESAYTPNSVRATRKMPGSGFQRPKLAGFENPAWVKDPMYLIFMLLFCMRNISNYEKYDRIFVESTLNRKFEEVKKEYIAGDPTTLYSGTGKPYDITELDRYEAEAADMDDDDRLGE